jgi:hypothetical protein
MDEQIISKIVYNTVEAYNFKFNKTVAKLRHLKI